MSAIPRQSIVDRSTYFRVGSSESKRTQHVETEAVQDFRRCERLNSVHSELQQVFMASQVNNSVAKENSIHKHKQAIQQVHDEMRRTSISRNVKRKLSQAAEFERNRQISTIESALEDPSSEISRGMEATHGRLIQVHDSLKEIFKKRESIREAKEREDRSRCEESKEVMLQQLRRRSAYTSLKSHVEREHVQRIREFQERYVDEDFCRTDQCLMDVQEEMIKLHRKADGIQKEKERQQVEKTKQRKSIAEEELLRQFNRKRAKSLSNIEWRRVISTADYMDQMGRRHEMKSQSRNQPLQAIHSELVLRIRHQE